jgi:ABC-2 type transport system permease protein
MDSLFDMIWIESRKALRSRMPLWTALAAALMPLGIAFLIFVARNPEISKQLGLISAKADLVAYAGTDWTIYLGLFGMVMAAGGLMLFGLVTSWIFGREFADGTLKDMLAVPVQRTTIVAAKFIVMAVWSAVLALVILGVGLVMGAIIQLPGASSQVFLMGGSRVMVTAVMVIAGAMPLALVASIGRGYLLPIGTMLLAVMAANVLALAGWGEYFPWGVPGIYAMGKPPLTAASYWIIFLTGVAGMLATDYWWKHADQNR